MFQFKDKWAAEIMAVIAAVSILTACGGSSSSESSDGNPPDVVVPSPPVVTQGSNPGQFTKVGNTVYFVANDGNSGRELWASQDSNGAIKVADLTPGEASSEFVWLTGLNDTLYFMRKVDDENYELLKTAGAAPERLLAFSTVDGNARIGGGLIVNERILFWISNEGNTALYAVNDTMVTPLSLGVFSHPAHPSLGFDPKFNWRADADQWIVFKVENESGGIELWRTDGSEINTGPVPFVNDAYTLGLSTLYWSVQGVLYFTLIDSQPNPNDSSSRKESAWSIDLETSQAMELQSLDNYAGQFVVNEYGAILRDGRTGTSYYFDFDNQTSYLLGDFDSTGNIGDYTKSGQFMIYSEFAMGTSSLYLLDLNSSTSTRIKSRGGSLCNSYFEDFSVINGELYYTEVNYGASVCSYSRVYHRLNLTSQEGTKLYSTQDNGQDLLDEASIGSHVFMFLRDIDINSDQSPSLVRLDLESADIVTLLEGLSNTSHVDTIWVSGGNAFFNINGGIEGNEPWQAVNDSVIALGDVNQNPAPN